MKKKIIQSIVNLRRSKLYKDGIKKDQILYNRNGSIKNKLIKKLNCIDV